MHMKGMNFRVISFKYSDELGKRLATLYPKGTRVECIHMVDDPQPILQGEQGTVRETNGFGQILVDWDNGRGIFLIYNVDEFKRI